MGEPSSTKIVQIILVNLKHGCQRAEFVLLYIYRENLKKKFLSETSLGRSEYILREISLAINFGDSRFRRNRTFNFIISKIYVDKRLRVQ